MQQKYHPESTDKTKQGLEEMPAEAGIASSENFLDPQAERHPQLLCCPHGGAWAPSPMAAAPTVMPRDGAVPTLDRVVGWALGFQRGPIAPQRALTLKLFSLVCLIFFIFFLAFKNKSL